MKLTLSGQTAINLSLAVNEMDVGYHYREFFSRKIQGLNFTSPFKCDGFGEHENLKIRLLCEFKENVNLKNKLEFATVLAQSIYYVKKFELTGIKLPTTILLGDRDECCVLHTNDIIEYLAIPFDWEIAPSSVDKHNLELIKMISDNEKINPFIFSVNQLEDVLEKIADLTDNVKRLIPITNHNITEVFDYFQKHILGKTILTTNELANLFVQILVNPFENYLHPVSKVSALVTKNFNQVPVKSRKVYQSFFEHFKSEYSPREKEVLTSIVDRLVEDTTRRKQGEFFTPTIWVDKAHEYIASVFGDDWKEKYVVWDPAWGTGNLTRDYKFKELYVSTLNQSDIDTANQMGYNLEAVKFQFDFLNDSDEKLPEGLRIAISEGREIIVLMNPPYATANVMGNNSEHKEGVAKTKMNELMVKEGWGKSSQNLYAQFYYRITKLQEINKNFKIGIFTPPLYLTGDAYKDFRNKFFNYFGFQKGFLFEAANFSDVAKGWGINFAIFSEKINNIKTSFIHDLIKVGDEINLVTYGTKILYNTDRFNQASNWVREDIKGLKTSDAPQASSAVVIKPKGIGTIIKDSLGYLYNNSNNVSKNNQSVGFFSSCMSAGHGLSVVTKNFFKCVNLFTSRRLISGQYANWVNWNDEYLKPNEEHEEYQQFTYDSIIYSLFESKSNQSSLRQITYKEKLWDIKNEFFWMSKEDMLNLANENSYSDLYNDARTDSDRYVYKLLFGEERIYENLSPDAKLVLDKATELVKKSMSMREVFANDENHLKSWDAGYAQLKLLWKQYYAEDFKEFRELYKNLEDRMRPLVYELGFLMK
jgi:hypothetical protein